MNEDKCLNCCLPDCDETHPDCYFKGKVTKQQRYYRKMRNDPEYKKKRRKSNEKWRQGSGREKFNASMRRWRKKNPEKLKAIQARHYRKKKESLSRVQATKVTKAKQ